MYEVKPTKTVNDQWWTSQFASSAASVITDTARRLPRETRRSNLTSWCTQKLNAG